MLELVKIIKDLQAWSLLLGPIWNYTAFSRVLEMLHGPAHATAFTTNTADCKTCVMGDPRFCKYGRILQYLESTDYFFKYLAQQRKALLHADSLFDSPTSLAFLCGFRELFNWIKWQNHFKQCKAQCLEGNRSEVPVLTTVARIHTYGDAHNVNPSS